MKPSAINSIRLIAPSVVVGLIILIYYLIVRKKASTMIAPLSGRVTSKFGTRIHPITGVKSYHNGTDIAAPSGTKVLSPDDGNVIEVNTTLLGGKQVIIKHDNGYRTGYAHLSQQLVTKGQRVNKGQVIALVGSTGQSTGPHLHFTLTSPAGIKINPESLFKF